MVGVGLAWAIPASLAPGTHPWPVGSTDGTVWNAMFVFNGFGKVSGAAQSTKPEGPGPFRLLVSTGWHYDVLFGCVLVAAIAIGAAAAIRAIGARAGRLPVTAQVDLPHAFAIALAVWIAFAVLVFDMMSTVHARYLEALAPALAAAIGYGAASLAGLTGSRGPDPRRASFAARDGARAARDLRLHAALQAGFDRLGSRCPDPLRRRCGADRAARRRACSCGEVVARRPDRRLRARVPGPRVDLPRPLECGRLEGPGRRPRPAMRRRCRATWSRAPPASRYELAVDEPLALAPLVIRDQRPILPLTSFGGRPLIGLQRLLAEVRTGAVRYGLVAGYHCGESNSGWAACGPAAQWIRHNGVDVSTEAGLVGPSRLYLLSPSRAG